MTIGMEVEDMKCFPNTIKLEDEDGGGESRDSRKER